MTSETTRFALRSNRVCTREGESAATIIVCSEKIEDVVPADQGGDLGDILCDNLGDLVIAPGIMDAHVHVNEPGRTDWEGFQTATKAAIAGEIDFKAMFSGKF